MDNMTPTGKIIIGVIIVVVLVVIVAGLRSQQPAGNSGISGSPAPTSGGVTSNVTIGGQAPGSAKKPTVHPTISVVTPAAGAAWKISTPNTISWSRAGGISGNIYLVDAQTKSFVGVILPQTGPQQTYYEWNTRDVFLDRTSPSKKTVLPGKYIVKIAFDGNNLPIIASPAVTITN